MGKWRHDYEKGFIWRLLKRVENNPDDPYWEKQLRAKIGVPSSMLAELVEEARAMPGVKDKVAGDGGKRGPTTIPLKLRIATVLSHMRTGGTLVGAADRADMDDGTLRRFRKDWAAGVAETTYKQWVKPLGGKERDDVLALHARLGFPGAISFFDGVHRPVDRVPWSQLSMHEGKEGYTQRVSTTSLGTRGGWAFVNEVLRLFCLGIPI